MAEWIIKVGTLEDFRLKDGEPYRILRLLIDGGLEPATGQGEARMI